MVLEAYEACKGEIIMKIVIENLVGFGVYIHLIVDAM